MMQLSVSDVSYFALLELDFERSGVITRGTLNYYSTVKRISIGTKCTTRSKRCPQQHSLRQQPKCRRKHVFCYDTLIFDALDHEIVQSLHN